MDFHRANRNLQLVESGVSDGRNPESFSLDETQVPVSSGFSSDSDKDQQEQIFINTQVQGRLDEAEEADKVRANLGQFRYDSQDSAISPKHKSAIQRPSARTTKRSSSSQRRKAPTKAQSLLKQLSGKHAKVQDMIKYQQKLDSLAGSQQRAKSKGKTTKTKKQQEKRYDTYNANEWQHIYNLLLEKFPHTRPSEVEDVYQYLYGDESEDQPLWNESQRPIEPESQDLGFLPPPPADKQRVSVLSLSQVMDDKHSREPDEDIIVPDSTDEEYIVIPIPSSPQPLRPPLATKPPLLTKPPLKKVESDAGTPKTAHSPSDGVIDLTNGSFKVVKSLISPLKEETAQVQVPATRMPTLGTTPNLAPTKEQPLRYRLHRSQLESFSAVEGLIVCSPGPSQDDVPVPDTESEDSAAEDHCMVELQPSILASRTPSPSVQSDWNSQSAQQLRQSMKSLGLKTSRSKRQMLHSLQQASQVLEIDTGGQENQRQEIHDYLTSLVQSSPVLLEKVYTFQPIASKELLTKLTEANPFVDVIDEYTIREWADYQGICLTTS
ncbi:ZYRO0F10516p [Zygosaccharomyces rouxii]|uniref:Structure-specific endonuclease subunit SLX4 n=1 Tax=Zygosaccharomyces rouxii (strain ATCC 2623 / CBS 732 / NBRC 1130 / NCYC 568 / NRRL Y-229) TaxID=559307 RepID=SLX4_ZYGRC|nr:uncharacterized protein ZYRO0F10516g [Zygosaccharomyces rouxii]C5DY61.1 RecName: Full=Structure-specific endonuclease subunit SLX4 [Zygosaccharomyces rouxii CBS 732]KAH9199480.1 structure-specific endonuclease subunit SLX4 [Zygosaccharomyces rouxii]CAR28722.1 ZYRO0F10516p [Zygosaccharomyces rouxii]